MLLKNHDAQGGDHLRDSFFDNLKAVLIFLVVFGHCISSFNDDGGYIYDLLYRIIFSFHMPAFIFISGYFAKPQPKRIIARLLPLYLIFQVVHMFLRHFEDLTEDPANARLFFQFFEPEWTLWYLMVLMIFALVLPLLDADGLKKQIRNLALAFVLGLLIGLNDEAHNFMDISRAFSFLPYFLMGYYAKKNQFLAHSEIKTQINARSVAVRLAAAAGGAALVICFLLPHCPFRGEMFYGTMSYMVDGYTVRIKILTYLIGFAWIFILLVLVPSRRIAPLGRIGRSTLGIYLFHAVVIVLLRINPAIDGVLNRSFLLMTALAVVLTLVLALKPFTFILQKLENVFFFSK